MATRTLFLAPALALLTLASAPRVPSSAIAPLSADVAGGGLSGAEVRLPGADLEPPGVEIVFSGTVRSAETGAPVAGAEVTLLGDGARAVADRQGAWTLELPRARLASEVRLMATAPGFRQQVRAVRVEGDAIRVDFRLAPADRERVLREREAEAVRDAATHAPGGHAPAPRLGVMGPPGSYYPPGFDTEAYDAIEEIGFRSPLLRPLSSFAADVDRASYANVRRFLTGGELPPIDAVRIEELVNYFSYDDPLPGDDRPFAVRTEVAPAPWRPAHRLVRIALRTPEVDVEELPPSNLVFLVDVSGSMRPPNKLPLLRRSLRMLVERLRAEDRVSLVVYAGAAGVVLEGARGDEKERILSALEELEAGGSTAGGEGLELAYRVAAEHRLEGGNNRILLATDGDFNVGVSSDAAMRRLVEEKREQGTFLTVLGFGAGNTKFSKMEKMADHGNGQFHYVDGILEARKALVEEMGGTLLTVAEDVKLQVEWNPARVAGYRLIGYENRRLAPEDFDDDEKDAGDLGAGHSVVAFYEVVPHGAGTDVEIFEPDSLRYQPTRTGAAGGGEGSPGKAVELGWLKVRYKAPDDERSELVEVAIRSEGGEPGRAFRFGSAVAEFGLVLRASPHRGEASLTRALERAREACGPDLRRYRAEFLRLVRLADELGAGDRMASSGEE